jgi:hypothetical protein
MTGIQQRLATGRGKFTTDYPELGTGPVNYEDSISEEFFVAERKAVFDGTGFASAAWNGYRARGPTSLVNCPAGWRPS